MSFNSAMSIPQLFLSLCGGSSPQRWMRCLLQRFSFKLRGDSRLDFLVFAVFAFVLSYAGRSCGESPGVEDESELIGALENAIVLGTSLEPISFVGEFNSTIEFPSGLVQNETLRVRMLHSTPDQKLVWAMERRSDVSAASGIGKLSINGSVVDKTQVFRTIGINGAESASFDSFDSAVAYVSPLHPAYWGIFLFPTSEASRGGFQMLLSRILGDSTSTKQYPKSRSLKFMMKERIDPEDLVTWTWVFDLPEMNPVRLKAEREYRGPRRTLFEQELRWNKIDGKLRPVQLVGTIEAIRTVPGPEKIEVGKKYTDMQINWLPYTNVEFTSFRTTLDAKKFIDEGFGLGTDR